MQFPNVHIFDPELYTSAKGRSPEKKCFLLDFVQITFPPPSPNLDNLYKLTTSDIEIQDLIVSLGLKILYVLYIIYVQPKTKFKVQIISILEEIDSFIDQKCTSWKCAKKWAEPSPLPHLDKIQKKASFFSAECP